jgi:competence protein ComEA
MNKIKDILDYYFNIICICLFLFLLTGIGVLIYRSFMDQNNTQEKEEAQVDESISILDNDELKNISVDIKGAIKNPGVYEIENGKNVSDLIKMAGGLKSNADTSNINLSRKLEDQMVIKIFTKSELKKQTTATVISECVCDTAEITQCSDKNVAITKTTGENVNMDSVTTQDSSTTSSDTTLISINTATKEELMTLNSIGEAKATAIIEYRTTNGNFKSIEEIKNVSGIGDSLFEKIKSYITI